jgi:hypothetical protein
MAKFTSPLDNLTIAAPCPANWDKMCGNDRVRFCSHCNLNVYNLSGMSRAEAERLLSNIEGRLCARFYRRADGTILTKNCPVGLNRLKQRVSRIGSALFSAAIGFLGGIGLQHAFSGSQTMSPQPQRTMGVIAVEAERPEPDYPKIATMGDVAVGAVVPRPRLGKVRMEQTQSPLPSSRPQP